MPYAIGLDYGTNSVRCLIVDVANGNEVATHVVKYPHGVIDEALPTGPRLGKDWALQHPNDWLLTLRKSVGRVMKDSKVAPEDVIGVGIDFTACTMLPVTADGTPLCLIAKYAKKPNAWPKLWKHHAAQGQADRINAKAREMGLGFLDRYGGKLSSEWMYAKSLQILEESPTVYRDAARLIEGASLREYQAHLIPYGGVDELDRLFGDGVLLTGDAGQLGQQVRQGPDRLVITARRGLVFAHSWGRY